MRCYCGLQLAVGDVLEGAVEGLEDAIEFDAHGIGEGPARGVIGGDGRAAGIGEVVRMVLG